MGVYRELIRSRDFYRVLSAGALAAASFFYDRYSGGASGVGTALALVSVLVNGSPILWGALKGLAARKVNVDELVALAIVASMVQGEFLTAAVVSFVMVMGSLVEAITGDSARKAIQALVAINPDTATRVVDGRAEVVAIDAVSPGETLRVRPGERIPVDAEIIIGAAAVDESSITGEPIPKEKGPGDVVFAGSLNQNGVIDIRATKVGADTTLGKVIEMVSQAESHRPEAVSLIDRYAQWFTPLILGCAAVTWFVTDDVSRAIAVLIVGCPCALILAAPTAIVAATGRAAKSGILVKGGRYLEEAGRADAVLFDKTGTLTEGRPRLAATIPFDGADETYLLSRAASVEQDSTHPLARAVLDAAEAAEITFSRAESMSAEIGLGVRADVDGCLVEVGSAYLRGGMRFLPAPLRERMKALEWTGATALVVYEDGKPLGALSVSDQVRAKAADTIRRLAGLGIARLGLLSGDHPRAARHVADEVGITEVWAQLKPGDKLDAIQEIQAAGHTVMYVGDGINDAPALAAANVGVAMGAAGTDVALETADIALMHDDISQLPFLVQLSRRTLRTIRWNIAFGLGFNAVAVLASGSGLLAPIMGALVHNIGSVLVVLSSASLAFASPSEAPAEAEGTDGMGFSTAPRP